MFSDDLNRTISRLEYLVENGVTETASIECALQDLRKTEEEIKQMEHYWSQHGIQLQPPVPRPSFPDLKKKFGRNIE